MIRALPQPPSRGARSFGVARITRALKQMVEFALRFSLVNDAPTGAPFLNSVRAGVAGRPARGHGGSGSARRPGPSKGGARHHSPSLKTSCIHGGGAQLGLSSISGPAAARLWG